MARTTTRRGLLGLLRGSASPVPRGQTLAASAPASPASPAPATAASAAVPSSLPLSPPSCPPPWQVRRQAVAAGSSSGSGAPPLLARVLAFNCIARTGCSVCLEHCPIEGALRLEGTRVRVDADLCDGCGACRPVCPAPEPAIDILPRLPMAPGGNR